LVHIKVFVDLMADIGCFEMTADIGEESATDNVEHNRILLLACMLISTCTLSTSVVTKSVQLWKVEVVYIVGFE
jgi:hypothetical protein